MTPVLPSEKDTTARGPGAPPEASAPLRVHAAGATKAVLLRIADAFSGATGIALLPVFGSVGALRDRLLQGEPADAVLLSDAGLDALEAQGLLAQGSRRPLGSVVAALACPAGRTPPDVSTPEALTRALLAARAPACGTPEGGTTAGTHFAGVLDRLGLRDRLAGRLTGLPYGLDVLRGVAEGRFDLGVSQSSEIRTHPGVTFVGPLPAPYGLATPYAAALMRHADARAWSFLAFLQGEAATAALAEAGFDREAGP